MKYITRIMFYTGMIMFMLGLGCCDSASLVIPAIMIFLGLGMVLASSWLEGEYSYD